MLESLGLRLADRAGAAVDRDREDGASTTAAAGIGTGEGEPVCREIGVDGGAIGECKTGVDAGGGASGQPWCCRGELEVGRGLCASSISAVVSGDRGNEQGRDIDAIVAIGSGKSLVISTRQTAITGQKRQPVEVGRDGGGFHWSVIAEDEGAGDIT